ncbi:mannosyltransferase [Thermomonas carbonis]|nr:mannosyltransferase [Thermomonas carbonis]
MDAPGSMRAYADVLMQAMAMHAPDVDAKLIEIAAPAGAGTIARRMETVSLPLRAWSRRREVPHVWHVLDGSRAYIAPALERAPVVITAHDIIPQLQQDGRFAGVPPLGRAARWLWRRNGAAMRGASALVCDSDSTRQDMERAYGLPVNALVVPLPVRPSLLAKASGHVPPRETGVVLHIGNNGFYKRREQVLRIFARLDRSVAPTLVMIGPAPVQSMRELARDLQIDGAVVWIEDASDVVVADWYQRASVMVFPSLYEGFGWPVLEAMAFGLPVVCSDAGSLPEVAGTAAPCLAPDDIDGFVRETAVLLRDPALALLRARAGRTRAEAFGLQRFANDMAAVYRSTFIEWSNKRR